MSYNEHELQSFCTDPCASLVSKCYDFMKREDSRTMQKLPQAPATLYLFSTAQNDWNQLKIMTDKCGSRIYWKYDVMVIVFAGKLVAVRNVFLYKVFLIIYNLAIMDKFEQEQHNVLPLRLHFMMFYYVPGIFLVLHLLYCKLYPPLAFLWSHSFYARICVHPRLFFLHFTWL